LSVGTRPKAIHIVYAKWCPHCVPTTVGPVERAAKELGLPVILHDIDTDDVVAADEMVEKFGDWTPDYLIPQVFLEMDDGRIEHVLTGDPRGLQHTRSAVEKLLKTRLSTQHASQ
jgi:thiol-disulfide isomerase/thioredoxin